MPFDEEHWVREEGIEYDEKRYDPDDPWECQECGSELQGAGDRAGAISRCPECEVTVMIV